MDNMLNVDVSKADTLVTYGEMVWHYSKIFLAVFFVALGIGGALHYFYKLAVKK